MFARIIDGARGYLTGGLLIALALVSLGWYIDNTKLAACQSGREADQANYAKAQAEAREMWIKEIVKKEKEYVEKAKKADANYGALAAKYNESIRLYVDAQGKARKASPTAGSGSPEGTNRPGENPFVSPTDFAQTELDVTQVAVVPVSDLVICGENTARLQVARDWALGLNK